MATIEVRFCDAEFTIEAQTIETTVSNSTIPATTVWCWSVGATGTDTFTQAVPGLLTDTEGVE